MIINRVWAMPNKWTFTIKPIAELLTRYVGDGKEWIDPCAGWNSPAEITNDLNPEAPTMYHLHAVEFCESLTGQYRGLLFDPPYSLGQMKELYQSIGIDRLTVEDVTRFYGKVRSVICRKINQGGIAISCGWNSIGIGKKWGFECIEILLVCHGRAHNDTIVTVERKVQGSLALSKEGK